MFITIAALGFAFAEWRRVASEYRDNRRRIIYTNAANGDLAEVVAAADRFHADSGRYPTTKEGLEVLLNPPAAADGWRGPYLKKISTDPWGNAYAYTPAVDGNSFSVRSAGADGRLNTNDDIVGR